MATLRISGDTSGYIDLRAPTTGAANVFTFPATTGTILTDATTSGINASAISVGTLGKSRLPTGSVLQVVQATGTAQLSTSSTSLVSSGFSASITPTSATSKIYVVFSGRLYNNATGADADLSIYRGATNIQSAGSMYNQAGLVAMLQSLSVLDSPATTSSTTYTIYFAVSTGTTYINVNGSNDGIYSLTLMEIAA